MTAEGRTATTPEAPGTALALRPTTTVQVVEGETIPSATARYLAFKRKRLTQASERSYRAALRDFAAFHPNRTIHDFEPPVGSALIEDFLVDRYGHLAGRTYNRGLSVIADFMRWLHARGELDRDPTLTLERAKQRQIHRTTFTDEQRLAILAANPDPRDQVALRLLLDYGLRKGALRAVRLEHFDHAAHRLTIFTKGETIHVLPLPDPAVWTNLELLNGQPQHYLWPKTTTRRRVPPKRKQLERMRAALDETRDQLTVAAEDQHCARELGALLAAVEFSRDLLALTVQAASTRTRLEPELPIGEHGCHLAWYRCLARAGIVEPGTSRGQRMHKARHSAGQRVLDKTGNLKAAQALLCHATIGTTGDVYTGWETAQLDVTLRAVIPGITK